MKPTDSQPASEAVRCDDLLGFLRGKLADAEQSLRSREAMANPPRISDEEIERLKTLPGTRVTKGRKLSKAEIKEMELEPARQKRIAARCRREVELLRAVIAALDKPNDKITRDAGEKDP